MDELSNEGHSGKITIQHSESESRGIGASGIFDAPTHRLVAWMIVSLEGPNLDYSCATKAQRHKGLIPLRLERNVAVAP